MDEKLKELEKRIAALEERQFKDQVSIILFSGDLDRALSAFIIATGAAAMGQQVSIFFTFWGLDVMRKQKIYENKDWLTRLLTLMAPSGADHLHLSKMDFWGVGTSLMKGKMADKNISSLEELIKMAQELGVVMIACEMTRELMNIRDEELIEGMKPGGVGTFLGEALHSRLSLFI